MAAMCIMLCQLFILFIALAETSTNEPEMACYTSNGKNYRGTIAWTVSGKTCQSWSAQTPHKHDVTAENYPDGGLEKTNCRNPISMPMPFCHTTDPDARYEYCPVPRCEDLPRPETTTIEPDLTCYTSKGVNYRGTVAKTVSGKTCQSWSAQAPHGHTVTPEDKPDAGLEKNYCRNPNNSWMPWCITTDPDTLWEYCPVLRCEDLPRPETSAIKLDLTCYTSNGKNYRGTVAQAVSGRTCQSWSAQTPQEHTYTPANYPLAGLEKNYCRNPATGRMPWCYTTDPGTYWEYCPVPRCEGKQVLKVKISDPTVDLNDPAVMEAILKQMKEKLKQQEVSGDVKLTWKKQPDGKVFRKEEKNRKSEL